jgi:hypothetical protein
LNDPGTAADAGYRNGKEAKRCEKLASRRYPPSAWVCPDPSTGSQGLTGALIGTVREDQGGVLPGVNVRVSSAALIGGPSRLTTNGKGQFRFPALPPGRYALDVELSRFTPFHEEDIRIGAGATLERTITLQLAGLAESIVVEGQGSRIEARDPGFGTRFGLEDLNALTRCHRSSITGGLRGRAHD